MLVKDDSQQQVILGAVLASIEGPQSLIGLDRMSDPDAAVTSEVRVVVFLLIDKPVGELVDVRLELLFISDVQSLVR